MHEEHRKILIDAIKSGLDFKESVSREIMSLKQELFLKQLDFFLQLASISIAILGIGYLFYPEKFDPVFGILSLVFSIINILWISSYTRFSIDKNERDGIKAASDIKRKMDIAIDKAIEALNKDDSEIYFNYAEEQAKLAIPKDKLNFSGEIFTFIFIISLLFLIFAFFKDKINFCFDYFIMIVIVLVVSYFLSSTNISGIIVNKLSEYFTPNKK